MTKYVSRIFAFESIKKKIYNFFYGHKSACAQFLKHSVQDNLLTIQLNTSPSVIETRFERIARVLFIRLDFNAIIIIFYYYTSLMNSTR